MTVEIAERHPNDEFIRVDRLPHIWCPGCGLGEVVGAFTKAIKNSSTPTDKHAVVSGIGCTGRVAGYVKFDSYHTTHGRAIPFATGLKLANKDLEVTVVSGDGDLSTIGGNHIIHAARRNIDLNIIFVNNFIYGMTGGQMSATTPHGAYSSTSQKGNFEHPFNMPFLMKAAGATFIARWTVLHLKQLQKSIEKAFDHPGFSFIEVISPCPKGFGRRNKFRDGITSMKYYEEMSVHDDTIELSLATPRMNPEENLTVGEFVQDKIPSYQQVKLDFLKAAEGRK